MGAKARIHEAKACTQFANTAGDPLWEIPDCSGPRLMLMQSPALLRNICPDTKDDDEYTNRVSDEGG